jgi:phenylacetate-CoA ligase
MRSEADFRQIPPLTRDDVREHYRDLIAEGWRERVVENATGGSCGQPVRFAMDPSETAARLAMAIRHNRWAGWDIGDRVGVLWGAPRDLARERSAREWIACSWLTPQRTLNAFKVTPDRMVEFGSELRLFGAEVLFGYAGVLVEFARVLGAARQSIPSLRTAVSSAEALSAEARAEIERALGCRVYDRYGARETGLIAAECQTRDGLHVAWEDAYVEIESGSVAGLGRVLVTKLNSRGMPFIRYDIGDLGEWVHGECPCGRHIPRLRLAGCRATDFLVSADGSRVSGAALTLVTRDLPELGQVQFAQRAVGQVEVRVGGRGELPSWVRQEVSRRLCTYLGAAEVTFSFHDGIARAPSGKYYFTVCQVAGPSGQ